MEKVGARIDGIAADLLAASRAENIAQVVVARAADALGGFGSYFGIVDHARSVLRTRVVHGFCAGVPEFPLDAELPATHVARTGIALVVGSPEEYGALFPAFWSEVSRHTRSRACVYVPVHAHHRVVGVLGVSFEHERRASEDDVAVLAAIARFASRTIE